MAKRIVLGVQITKRVQNVPAVQAVLTEYGCNIKTRLGLHEVTESICSTVGLLLLDTYGEEKRILELEAQLKAITGVVVQKMVFEQ
ncbi:MAG: hypothetical protein M0009_04460 [Deltaproteobacteria bacterium]|nr:hypothetical protein [Deltaproteobacteria bacterium]